MPSTYSSSLRLELIATGEKSGIWGNITNNNLGTLLEQAITGVITINLTGTTYTLSNLNGTTDEARNAVIEFTGTLTGNCTVTAPSSNKVYLIANNTLGGHNIIMTTGSGITISIPNGATYLVYTDGTDFFIANNYDPTNVNITGGTINNTSIGATTASTGRFTTLQATGALTLTGAVANIPNNLTFNGTGSVTLPVGTTGQQPVSPVSGMIRYNSSTDSFEGYTTTFGWGAIGGGNATNTGFWQNIQTITGAQAIQTGYNASSVGPITIDPGASVTVPTGSRWLVL
jgi:hypothetical protein